MFKKLRQKIEESDTVKKANDSLLGKYLSPPGQQADSTSLGSESPISSSASSAPHHQHPGGRSRSRQSSVGSAVSEATSSAATPAAGAGESVLLTSAAAAASPLESLSRQELLQRLCHAQSLARRYKARLFEADNRLRESGAMPKLAARDRLIEALKLQSNLLSEGRPVPDELLAEIRQAESEVAEVVHVDLDGQKKTNGDNLTAAEGGDCEETAGKQAQMMQTLEAEAKQLRELLAVKTAELEEQQKQLARAASSSGNAGEAAAAVALELRLREAEARLTAAEQRHRDERAIAAEEAAAGKRRLKQQLAELQQQLASREREASLKDSTGATRESEIRTLKERLDSRLASEKRLRDELKSRGAEASRLADQLRVSRLEAENLARECREQRRQLDAGLTDQLEQLESQQADRLKAAAREFQDRLDAKEREFQAKFQEAVDRFQEAEGRARAAHRLETDELLQGLEAREVAEGRLKRRLDAAEAERDAAVAELTACQSAAVDDVERLSADVAEAEAGRLAAEATVAELRAQLEAATADEADGGFRDRDRVAIRSAASDAAASSTATNSAVLLSSLSEQVEQVRVAAVWDRHTGDSVSLEDYEAVKMYAADLQKQLMSVSSELAELRTCAPQQPPPPPLPPPAPRQHHQNNQLGTFTELPEAEYLRNVLYKYMLGEKTQTLARVICTVLKFTDYQIQQIMDHEGRRAATWLVAP